MAVTAPILEVQPFDQPKVQAAKDMTESVLQGFEASGALPYVEAIDCVEKLVSEAKPCGCMAIMAYVRQAPDVGNALSTLRRKLQGNGVVLNRQHAGIRPSFPALSGTAS